jgi:hypothetical protein
VPVGEEGPDGFQKPTVQTLFGVLLAWVPSSIRPSTVKSRASVASRAEAAFPCVAHPATQHLSIDPDRNRHVHCPRPVSVTGRTAYQRNTGAHLVRLPDMRHLFAGA